MEKEITHSSVLAWNIPGMGESGGLLSMGSHRIRHDWSDLASAAAAHPYMTTGKTIALTRWTVVGKVILCFWICCLVCSWLFFQGVSFNFMAAVTTCSDFGTPPPKIKSVSFLIYLPWNPTLGDLPNPGIEAPPFVSPGLAGELYTMPPGVAPHQPIG